jgi:predicted nucleotidyltransferase
MTVEKMKDIKIELEFKAPMNKLIQYAKKLGKAEKQLEEVVIIGSFLTDDFNDKSDIDLVCVFDEDWIVKDSIYESGIIKLRELRNRMSAFEQSLKIGHPIDLMFITENGVIFGTGGLISFSEGPHEILLRFPRGNFKGERGGPV